MHALEFAGRHLSPTSLTRIVAVMAGRDDELNAALAASRAIDWPERLKLVRECLEPAAESAAAGIAGLREAGDAPQPIVAAYRALRNYAQAAQSIYPMSAFLRPVSQFFLEQPARDDAALLERLAVVDPARDKVGVMHAGGPPGTRGGFSLYVPETYDASRRYPLVVAMHGGSGNGGAFLWSWVREARTRGLIVLAPTAIGSTWSLMDPDTDGPSIDRMVDQVGQQWNIDADRQLLTGMSDGGTFSYVLGVRSGCRFTHLAPVAAAFHPMMLTFADEGRLSDLPIYIVHGVQDWMFPPHLARQAEQTLGQAGAKVVYREIADLSHTYPRDENAGILDWFMS
ncbi:MAG: phospholipase [Reyranella sp.]|nr:phospholipase [Reyranella sp.]